jgi:hypothetical protein
MLTAGIAPDVGELVLLALDAAASRARMGGGSRREAIHDVLD